jgi:hypothetical protein
MRVLGASSICAAAVVDELIEAAFHGRPAIVYSNGPDLIGVFAEGKETTDDVLRMVPRVVPELRGAA